MTNIFDFEKPLNFSESIFAQIVYNVLAEKYPKESISREAFFDKQSGCRADFVIIDKKTSFPVMIIELKAAPNKIDAQKRAFESLKKEAAAIKQPVMALAAIAVVGENLEIEFVDYTDAIKENDFSKRVENASLPSYDLLTAGTERKAIDIEKTKQKKSINVLKVFCWFVIPVISLAVIILDRIDVYEITTLRLILLGALGLSLLIPCFQEIKIGTISLKNKTSIMQNQSQDTPKKESKKESQ